MTRNSNAFMRDGSVMADSHLVDFFSGSTDSAINLSGSADLHNPIPPLLQDEVIYLSSDKFIGTDKFSVKSAAIPSKQKNRVHSVCLLFICLQNLQNVFLAV